MTLYDAAMVGLIIGGRVWGAWRGIVWQIASLLSLVLGYTVAHTTSDDLAVHFPGDPIVARGLAMMVIYVCTSGGVFFGAWLIRATLRKLRFEAYDRHLGMVLGGLEGALVGIIATIFVVSLAPQSRQPIFSSLSGKAVGVVLANVGPVLPTEARDVLKPFWDNPQDTLASDRETPGSDDNDDDRESTTATRTSEDHGRSRATYRR